MTEPIPGLPARLIQLVARFRPDADGVGETALRLADVLLKQHGIPSDFLVYNPPRDPALEIPKDFPHTIEQLNRGRSASLASALDRLAAATVAPPVLLLHYTSYGYSAQGMPFWLNAVMKRFVHRGGRLLTLFHELYALPRFPSKTFFTSGIQRRIFRRLLATGNAAFTSNEDFLETMRRNNRAHRPVSLIGICSSAGEPEQPRPLAGRKRRMAIFGRFATRKRLYALHLAELERIARHLGIEEVADIGAIEDPSWMEENVKRPLGSLVRTYGTLSVSGASELLEDSMVGTLAYNYSLTGKSSVFAAYQAHAMAILLFPEDGGRDVPEPGSWTLTADAVLALPAQSPALFESLQQSASAAHTYYRQHRSVHAMAQIVLPMLAPAGEAR